MALGKAQKTVQSTKKRPTEIQHESKANPLCGSVHEKKRLPPQARMYFRPPRK